MAGPKTTIATVGVKALGLRESIEFDAQLGMQIKRCAFDRQGRNSTAAWPSKAGAKGRAGQAPVPQRLRPGLEERTLGQTNRIANRMRGVKELGTIVMMEPT